MLTAWTEESLRKFEGEVKEIFLTGAIRGPVHLSGGNEAPLLKIFQEVNPEDWVFSTHRSHFHALLKGVPPELVKREILAGRSIHLNFPEYRFFTSAIVGGCLPIALGVAMAIQRRGEARKVWAFIGDMAATTGIFHESRKYARNFNLPLTICIEDNGYSTNTPTRTVWGIERTSPPGIVCLEKWEKGKVLDYFYTRVYPHINAGQFVIFR